MKNLFRLLIALLLLGTIPSRFLEAAYVPVTAPSAVILEPHSGKLLFSKAPHRRQPPASTAKVITALVTLDSLSLNGWVTVSPLVTAAEPSKLYLRSGEELQVRDLLKAVLMNSANDAARALAVEIAGSERAFAALMNEKARLLGAANTHFINASGLPGEGQYSTAYDLALIMREAMKNPFIASILKQRRAVIETSAGRRYYLKSHNKMLLRGRDVFGKTGYTRRARYCFVGWIHGGRQDLVVAMLGSRKLWDDLASLVNHHTGWFGWHRSKVLSYGARGEEVKAIQRALKRAGFFKGPVTGYFGKQTKLAVLRFQSSKNLIRDGLVGPQTRKALSPYF